MCLVLSLVLACMCVFPFPPTDMLFCQDNRDQVRFDNPEIKPHDVARKFGEMWKAAPEDLRMVCVSV